MKEELQKTLKRHNESQIKNYQVPLLVVQVKEAQEKLGDIKIEAAKEELKGKVKINKPEMEILERRIKSETTSSEAIMFFFLRGMEVKDCP